MLTVLVTGSKGFVGKNICAALKCRSDLTVLELDLGYSTEDIDRFLAAADIIFHLAGVNRPKDPSDFEAGNVGFTAEICSILARFSRAPKIVFASSIQADLDNPYGSSKLKAESVLQAFAADSNATCVAYRLKNLFGKWCRPNYNSVTATFCYNISHDLPISISDPAHEIELTYIDDVVNAFLSEIATGPVGFRFGPDLPSYSITLGNLATTLRSFRAMRKTLELPDFSDPFVRALYATYTSYLEPSDLAYRLELRSDHRGSLAEYVKTRSAGQFFVSRTHPGVTRGDHFHHTKVERFLVLQGEALIRFRSVLCEETIEYQVRGEDFCVLDIPPGYTHSIQNVGREELVTLFWADEVFDAQRPDTFHEQV